MRLLWGAAKHSATMSNSTFKCSIRQLSQTNGTLIVAILIATALRIKAWQVEVRRIGLPRRGAVSPRLHGGRPFIDLAYTNFSDVIRRLHGDADN